MHKQASFLIKKLKLKPHPEGGYFRETYRSSENIPGNGLPGRFGGRRPFSTAILFLLEGSQFSACHRLRSDEIWYFHAGSALTLVAIAPGGRLTKTRLGSSAAGREVFQAWIPAGTWFGAYLNNRNSYALVSCTVAPGFTFRDFELGQRKKLLKLFPQHRTLITKLTVQ